MFLFDGTGGPSAPVRTKLGPGAVIVNFGDCGNDGLADLVLPEQTGTGYRLGTEGGAVGALTTPGPTTTTRLAVADWTGDGNLDVIRV